MLPNSLLSLLDSSFSQSSFDSPLPPTGPPTGAIIGAIIAVILLLAVIGAVIALYRKHRDKKLREGPPKYKPPPPKKTNSSGGRQLDTNHISMDEGRPLQDQYYTTQTAEPVTDLDTWHDDDDGYGEKGPEHYFSAAPSGWDDPGDNEVLPSYMHTGTHTQNHQQGPTVNRGDSFVSPAMFV